MTPHRLMLCARMALVAGGAGLIILMLGPFSGLEKQVSMTDKEAHALAFYLAANIAFLAFPKFRRNEIALILVTFGALIEVAQALVGRDAELADWLADLVGLAAAVLPVLIEQLRSLMREQPWLLLGQAWRRYDRRGPWSWLRNPAGKGLSAAYFAGRATRSTTSG